MIAIGDLETYLGLSGGTDTALLLTLEAAAVDFVERFTHRFFGSEASYTEYLRGDGGRELILEETPASLPATITEQAYPGATATTVTASADDGYVLRGRTLVRKGGYGWTRGYEYVVAYTRGYTQTAAANPSVTPEDVAAPDDIRMAVLQIVALLYNRGTPAATATAIKSETIGDYSYTLGGADQDAVFEGIPTLRQTLWNWRRLYV